MIVAVVASVALVLPGASHAAAADPAAVHLAAVKGMGLADATERIGWQRRAPGLDESLRQSLIPGAYGGVWIGDDERIKVGLVSQQDVRQDAEQRSIVHAAVRRHALDGVADIRTLRHSLAALISANRWLDARLTRVNRGARQPLGTAYSVVEGSVELRMPSDSRALTHAQRVVVGKARHRYGAMLKITTYRHPVRPEQCAFPNCNAPLRAGPALYPECTLGFPARSRSDNRLYILTAGHCLEGRSNSTMWYARRGTDGARHDIGRAHRFIAEGPGDVGIIRMENPEWHPRAWVYVLASSANGGVAGTVRNTRYPIYRTGGAVERTRVCHTGRTTGTSCGQVVRLGARLGDVGNLVETNYCSDDGDSGGPVYASNTAYGIHYGSPPNLPGCHGHYQPILAAQNLMNVNVSVESG